MRPAGIRHNGPYDRLSNTASRYLELLLSILEGSGASFEAWLDARRR